jgi:hypothetical protein
MTNALLRLTVWIGAVVIATLLLGRIERPPDGTAAMGIVSLVWVCCALWANKTKHLP